jgi:hypothetical protein
MLVPVSPSGTGKTFRASISWVLFSSHVVAAANISLKSCPLAEVTLLILPVLARISIFALCLAQGWKDNFWSLLLLYSPGEQSLSY